MTTGAKPHSEGSSSNSLREQFFASGDPLLVSAQRTRQTEETVQAAWREHLLPVFPSGLAVLAVGGFGRGELFPCSDVDVLLLVESERQAQDNKAVFSSFIQTLWDSNLRLSHSVRTVSECCEIHDGNTELTISLIDQRFLDGDQDLHAKLVPRLDRFLDTQKLAIARELAKLTRTRHAQFQDSIYHLEPNVKESPGALRDIHLLAWLRKLEAPATSALAWGEVVEPARLFQSKVRCFLHFRSSRDNNLLTFDAQDEFAELPFSGFDSPESCMRDYYRHARATYNAAIRVLEAAEAKGSSLLAGFRDWRSRLSNTDFTVVRDRVFVRTPLSLAKDYELALRLFQFIARHGIPLSLEAERQLSDAAPELEKILAEPLPLWPIIRELLSLPHVALALRAMQDTGILRLISREWASIECLVVRDFYHRYTVDEHTLVAIENLQSLLRAPHPGHRRFATLLGEIEDPAVLRLAVLFHDVGKGSRTGDHATESARLAGIAMQRIGVPERHDRMIRFLIEQHLALSSAMTSRDLDDPTTSSSLAERIGTVEALRYLTLLTYADISAVNPTSLSPWRLEQLWRVYLTTHHQLNRELQSDRIVQPPKGAPAGASFLKGLPTRYLRTHSEEEIRLHLELEERRQDAEIALDIRKRNGGYQLTVLAKDRLFLFASVAGALASFGMNILKAEAFANQQGTILDTFVFADPSRTLELNPPEMERLQLTIERVLLGRVRVRDLLRFRAKPNPPSKRSSIEPRVVFDNDASDSATLVELVAEDRPGLLYDIASVLSAQGCNIELVLVDTEAHKAVDVFYVSHSGRKLIEVQIESLRELLTKASRG